MKEVWQLAADHYVHILEQPALPHKDPPEAEL
jgi:hypothetical protein